MDEGGSLSFGHWLSRIHKEIESLSSRKGSLYVYTNMFSFIISSLESFIIDTSKHLEITNIIQPNEDPIFKQLHSLLLAIQNLLEQQKESEWLQYFLDNPLSTVYDQLSALVEKFNEGCLRLNLSEHTIILWHEEEIQPLYVEDIEHIQKLLIKMNSIDFGTKISEIQVIIEKYAREAGIDAKTKKPMALERSVIQRSLLSFEKWEIDLDDLEFQKRIGSGGFADVYLGYRKSDGKIVAIKRLHVQKFDKSHLEMFKREIDTLSALHHFAIVPFVGACTKETFCIITEFMSGGSLFSKLHARGSDGKLSPTQLSIIALGIAYGMEYLHSKQVMHRDLKSLNILLDADKHPKICDFGMARTEDQNNIMTGGVGTPQWTAPEVLLSTGFYNEKADVYSYGIILWEMVTGDIPYRGLNIYQIASAVKNRNNRPKIPKSCPKNLANFIQCCWDGDSSKRPEFKEIVRALEKGAISFPGTDLTKLKEYVSQFNDISKQDFVIPVVSTQGLDPQSITPNQLDLFMNEFRQSDQAIPKLFAALKNPHLTSYLNNSNVITLLLDHIKSCSDTRKIVLFISLLSALLKKKGMVDVFIKEEGLDVILSVLSHFSTSMNPKLLECFLSILETTKIEFTREHLTRISLFLICTDMAVRQTSILLISRIIETGSFEKASDFNVISDNLKKNLIPEGKQDLLISSVNLLLQIITISKKIGQNTDSIDQICSLLNHDNEEIVVSSLKLLCLIFDGYLLKPRIISTFINNFVLIIERKSEKPIIEALKTLTIIMTQAELFTVISTISTFYTYFIPLINYPNETVRLLTLRIIFSFSSNNETRNSFIPIIDEILPLLALPTCESVFASYTLSSLFAISNISDSQYIESFLRNALSKEKHQTEAALRMAGVYSTKMNGMALMEQWNIIGELPKFLESKNINVVKVTIMVISSISSMNPNHKIMYEVLPFVFQNYSKIDEFDLYVLVCLVNSSIIPAIAQKCLEHLDDILGNMQLATNTILPFYIKLFSNIVKSNEISPECASKFVDIVSSNQGITASKSLFEIFESLAVYPKTRRVLNDKNINELLQDQITKCKLIDINRSYYLRIRAKLKLRS